MWLSRPFSFTGSFVACPVCRGRHAFIHSFTLAGTGAAIRAYASLSAAGSGDLTAVLLPSGRDPAERLRRDGLAALRDTLASSTCPLADIVVNARISHWAHDGDSGIPNSS
jgi:hypothetical protein